MAAARAAYFSGSASVTAAMPIITSYPGAGLVELAEKSDNVILKNVGYANKLGTNSYVVYDDGIAHSNIQPLKFFKLDDIYLDHKTGTGLETSLQQEIDTINGESFTNDRENVLVDSNGMQLYFREEGGKAYIYAANPSYSSGEIVREYSDDAEFVLYGSGTNKGMPYCIPYTSSAGDFLKIIEYSANNDIQTMQYWNVGSDGNLCTGDDILVRHESQFAYEQAYGTGSVANYGDLYSYANKYVRMDFTGKTTMPIGGIDFRVRQDKGGITYEGSTSSCFDVMEPNDCKLLFNVCDPVMCPPSRFTMQGRWQVDNVIQSGMIGSLVLGWGNGDAFPICLTGVQASLHYWKSMLDAYVDCLETSKYEGKTVGICDKLQSVYLCEIIVNEVAAIFDSQGGLLGLFNKNSFGERASGGEYLKFQENVQSTKDAFTYFTTEYSQTAFGAFKGRSFKEIGTTICKSAVYGKMPVFGDFMSKLSQPEDPTQFFATLMVRPYSEANDQSAYQVYYHIYAGSNENIPRVVYSVRLYNSITGEKYPMTGKCGGVSGTIDNAGMVDETIDCILDNTAGGEYDQVCIVINGDETCGFGQVSTMFSTEYVKDMFVADEAMRNVSTQEQCYPSYPTASPTISQVGSTNVILPYQFGEFTSGIRRVCSIENPGMGQGNSNDWKNIGTCGNDHEGRFLGYCWMDSETVTVKDAKRSATVDEWMTENDFKNNALAAGIGELYDETKSAEKIAELEEQHKGANCASLTTLPPQLSDFLDRSVSYSHSAQAWMLMGQTYRDIVQKCDVKGSVDVEVKFVVNSLEESTPGGSAYPIYVDAGDSIELEISGISSQDVVDIDSNIFGPSNCDPSSTPYKCSFTIAMSDQTDESAHISITLGGDERFNQNFVFTTKTEVGTALQSTMSDCSKCGVLGLRCTSTICHNNGEDCFYETAGTLNGCDSCYHLSSCSQLNGDEHRCWSNSVCLRAAGLRCAWDSNTSTCVNEGGGEVGSVGRDPISDYEEYQQPPHPSNLARVIAENWVLNSPTSQQSADMTTDADRDGNPDAGKEHRSVWTSPCCGAWTGLILSDAGFEEKYYITDVGYNGMTAPYNTIGEVINDWGYPIVINERCGCSKYDSQCNSQTCGSGDYCGYGNLCNTRRYGSHSYLLLGVGPESKEFYLYEIETMVGIDDNVRQDMIDSLDAKGTFSNTDALLVGYSGSTYGTVFGKIDINQLPSNNNGELRWPIRQLKPFAPR